MDNTIITFICVECGEKETIQAVCPIIDFRCEKCRRKDNEKRL